MSMDQMMSQLGESIKQEDFQEEAPDQTEATGSLDSFLGIGGLGGLSGGLSSGVGKSNGATFHGSGASGQNPQNRIFVTQISTDLKEDDLRIYFEGFGKLCDFYMPAQIDGLHKGMTYLSFVENVDKALVLQNTPHVIGGYEVACDDAKPKNDSPSVCNYYDWGEWGSSNVDLRKLASTGYTGVGDETTPASTANANDWGNWQGAAGTSSNSVAANGGVVSTNVGKSPWSKSAGKPNKSGGKDSWGVGKAAGSWFAGKSVSTTKMNERQHRVFVTRIGEDITKPDLEAYFNQFGELTDIFVPLRNPGANPQDGAHKGIAFVSFKDKDTYEEVLSRDKYEIKPDVFIVVDKAAGKESRTKGKGDSAGKWGAASSKMGKSKGKYGQWDSWLGGGDDGWGSSGWDDWSAWMGSYDKSSGKNSGSSSSWGPY